MFYFGVWHILLLSNILDFVPCDLQLQRAYRARFYRDDRFAFDVRIVWNNCKSVFIWSSRSLDKTFCDRDDPYVRDECMETRLYRPDSLAKYSERETILASEIVWKPGLASPFSTPDLFSSAHVWRLVWRSWAVNVVSRQVRSATGACQSRFYVTHRRQLTLIKNI